MYLTPGLPVSMEYCVPVMCYMQLVMYMVFLSVMSGLLLRIIALDSVVSFQSPINISEVSLTQYHTPVQPRTHTSSFPLSYLHKVDASHNPSLFVIYSYITQPFDCANVPTQLTALLNQISLQQLHDLPCIFMVMVSEYSYKQSLCSVFVTKLL